MQMSHLRPLRVVGLIAGLIALASCSSLPTAPSTPGQDPAVASSGTAQTAVVVNREPAPSPTPTTTTTPTVAGIPDLVGSAFIDGRRGGTLIVGRWKVVVPDGAYNGIGLITITVPDTTVDKCDLNIYPQSLNHFDEDVDLRYRCSTLAEAASRDMRWWNPSTQSWVILKSWVNDGDVTRCAPLKHFSTYASGKAGW